MSQSEEVMTAEAEEYLEEEFEDEMEDELEMGDEIEEVSAEEGAFPSPDGEEEGGEEVETGDLVAAGSSGKASRGRGVPNPLQLLAGLRPARLAAGLRARRQGLQRLLWRLEDASVFTAKFAAKAAVRAVRPALVWLIVARAMRTLDASRDPRVRMLRQPPHKRIDYYYSSLLGKDWEKQFEQDMLDAIREVDEGLVTDDAVEEKRKLAAIMLRRMEVEEWDKERMRHFYYGLYGMGPWYWDMEERLHNPFFTGARGWNGPPEAWVGQNQVFARDAAPGDVDFREAALDAIGAARGRSVAPAARAAAAARERLGGGDVVLGGRLMRGVVDPVEARARIEEARAAEEAAAA